MDSYETNYNLFISRSFSVISISTKLLIFAIIGLFLMSPKKFFRRFFLYFCQVLFYFNTFYTFLKNLCLYTLIITAFFKTS